MELGERVLGQDGTYRKVMDIQGERIFVQAGLSPFWIETTEAELDAWAAPTPPGRPSPEDYDGNIDGGYQVVIGEPYDPSEGDPEGENAGG